MRRLSNLTQPVIAGTDALLDRRSRGRKKEEERAR
jgi:hypothetical protein